MEKLKEKLNANVVGANCIRPHFKEMTLKNKNGITLIALIITIIVMLILVGVTINVALNGGLFTKASEASKQTQMAADRETLQSAVLAALDSNLEIPNAKALKDNLPSGWDVTGADGGPYTCTNTKTGNKFTVAKDGKITPDSSGGGTTVGQNFPYGTYYKGGAVGSSQIMTIKENMIIATIIGMNSTIEIKDEQTVYLNNYGGTAEIKYFVTENNVIIQDGDYFMAKNENDLVFNLNGEYIRDDKLRKYKFNKNSNEVIEYWRQSTDHDWNARSGEYYYVAIDGKIYFDNSAVFELSSEENSFTREGIKYTNENDINTVVDTTETIQHQNQNAEFMYGTYISLAADDGYAYRFEENIVYSLLVMKNITVSLDEETETMIIETSSGDIVNIEYDKTEDNIILKTQDIFGDIYALNNSGFEYDIQGDYYYGATRKWSFDGNGTATDYMQDSNGNWNVDSKGIVGYYGFNGTYYLNGEEITFNDDRTEFTWDGYTYTKATE